MKLMKTDSGLFKTINLTVFYALALNITVPAVHAMSNAGKLSLATHAPAAIPVPVGSAPVTTAEALPSAPIVEQLSEPAASGELELASMAIASGGGQPENEASLNTPGNLVDPFTGDFSYSIPLMDVEGYPIVISYNSNVGMNSEASWVGLGWSLNVGSISREMRGIPDEFDGTQSIDRTVSQKDDATTDGYKKGFYAGLGISATDGTPVGGNIGINFSFLRGGYTNSYLGTGRTYDLSLDMSTGISISGQGTTAGFGTRYGLNFNVDTKQGINLGFGGGANASVSLGGSLGISGSLSSYNQYNYNSRAGLVSATFTRGWSYNAKVIGQTNSVSSSITYGTLTSVPRLQVTTRGYRPSATSDRYFDALVLQIGKLKENYSSLSQQITEDHKVKQPALGYFHSGQHLNATSTSIPIMDFNRSNEAPYSDAMKNLPFSMQTFDVFYVNAMGISGTFRGQRTDIGTYGDAQVYNINTGVELATKQGKQLLWPATRKEVGEGVSVNSIETGELEKSNGKNVFEFSSAVNAQNGFDEAVYFKAIGEETPSDLTHYDAMGGFSPARPAVQVSADGAFLGNVVTSKSGVSTTIPASGELAPMESVAATVFRPMTVSEMTASPNTVDQSYASYTTVSGSYSIDTINRNTRPDNLLSKVEVISTDGTRYGYGVPCYSNERSDVSFTIGDPTGVNPATPNADGTVTYSPTDNTVLNGKGLSNLYDKTTVPAYAESFLLTEMLSPDYIDRTGNGPTLDDIGSYYKFNHTRFFDDYKWRFPIGDMKAFYLEGTLGSQNDDIASYTYGKKEIWYTHSVESKNFIAEFVLGNREDGFGVDENGALTDQQLQRLRRIELYNRAERLGPNGHLAKPLQTVEFTYSYELCPDYPGNDPSTSIGGTGKLTLKSIRVYSGTSRELGRSEYAFDYGTGSANPSFNYQNVDAWGNYKPNDASQPNSRFPYGTQNESWANTYSKAWKLVSVTNPAGGKLTVDYEADRYAYVQNKRAMKHIEIKGLTNLFDLLYMRDVNAMNLSRIYNDYTIASGSVSYPAPVALLCDLETNYRGKYGRLNPDAIPNNVIVFKLETPISTSTPDPNSLIVDKYFSDNGSVMKELFVKVHTKIKGSVTDLVPVFCTISNDLVDPFNDIGPEDDAPAIGVLPPLSGSGNYEYGYVIVEPVKVSPSNILDFFTMGVDVPVASESFSPFVRASNEYLLKYLPEEVYGNTAFTSPNLTLDLMAALGMDIHKALRNMGYSLSMTTAPFDQDMDGNLDLSRLNTLRLYAPSHVKFGGNARVKSITYADNWNVLSGEAASTYEWLYDYSERMESSAGVASYESRASRDESAFYKWDSYYDIRVLFPDVMNFTPEPVMEMLYPTGVVGYSRMSTYFNGDIERGYMIHKFHTARTYPTQADKTDIGKSLFKKAYKLQGRSVNFCGFSQGFSIETNDFHGKPHQTIVFKGDLNTEVGEILDKTTYKYYGIDEKIPVVDEHGAVSMEPVSIECDIHADARFATNKYTYSYEGLERIYYLPPPFKRKHVTKAKSRSETSFFTHALVKHTNRSAILKGIETVHIGSANKAEYVVRDKRSGSVILSSMTDEFDDKIYNVLYPAYWHYPELRPVHGVKGSQVSLTITSGGGISTPNIADVLTPGDVVRFPGGTIAWVARSYPLPTNNALFLIDADGNGFSGVSSGTYMVTIEHTNRHNALIPTMQATTTKKLPWNGGSTFAFPQDEILGSTAMTFRDRLSALCGESERFDNNNAVETGSVNPYLYGHRGDLVASHSLVWQSGRNQALADHGVRFDGTYTTYTPYYDLGTDGRWYQLNHLSHPGHDVSLTIKNWRKTGEITEYDQYGKALESKDQIGVYSSVLYGYNDELALVPIGEAVNARQQEIAFDGFEDYTYYDDFVMTPFAPHFNFRSSMKTGATLDQTTRHSGLTSMKIEDGEDISFTALVTTVCDPATGHYDGDCGCTPVTECDCIPPFSPTPGNYIVGAWVKEDFPNDAAVTVDILDAGNTVIGNYGFFTSGNKLDGWQRIEGAFAIPSGATKVRITIHNGGQEPMNVDDVRIHPALAGMVTAVYDPKTLLKLASHDAYNYTTFYNYDENLNLVKVRVETAKGIQTISETEFSTYKP